MNKVSICWFRRDLRLHDNAAIYHALKSGNKVVPVFIFDTNILDDLADKKDKRVQFIHDSLTKLQEQLIKLGSTLHVLNGTPIECFKQLMSQYNVSAVFTNKDYEPYAKQRDSEIKALLGEQKIPFNVYKDHVIFERDEVLKDDGTPYTVYTPYRKKWKAKLNDFYQKGYSSENYLGNLYQQEAIAIPTIQDIGFEITSYNIVPASLDKQVDEQYHEARDIPSAIGTTKLSVHLRFGTISIRQLVRGVKNEKLLNELIWRDFYQMILWHFPHVVHQSFKPDYDNIEWRNSESDFEKWCKGETGYPIVDAGMRELNKTGYMHNRVRMIVASFLTKHLLIDWRWGEAYFAEKLLDFDLASNNGGWQWAAGSGCDAAPYFRVFNPYIQTKKFDSELKYIRKWVPELEDFNYPQPIIEHSFARERCLSTYKAALKNNMKTTT